MKNSHSSLFCLFIFLCLCLSLNLAAQTTLTYYNQSFVIDTLYPATGSTGMNSPWEVLYGPDDSLWVTESRAYKVWKIHPGNIPEAMGSIALTKQRLCVTVIASATAS